MKTPIGAFNQEKALVGASSVIVKSSCAHCAGSHVQHLLSPRCPADRGHQSGAGAAREICRQLPSAAATPAPAATATIFHLSEEIEMLKNTIDHINTVIWLHFMSLNKNRNGENIFCVINHSTWDEWMVAIV